MSDYIEHYLERIFTTARVIFSPRVLIAMYVIVIMFLVFAITSIRVSSTTIGYEIADISSALVSQEVEAEALRREYDALVSYEYLYNKADALGYQFAPQGVTEYYLER